MRKRLLHALMTSPRPDGSLVWLLAAITLLASATPAAAADEKLLFEGKVVQSTVKTSHIRAGCPGPRYLDETKVVGPQVNSVAVPSDFSCQVMSMDRGKLEWNYPGTGIVGELPKNQTQPQAVAIAEPIAGVLQSKMSGTMNLLSGGGETHTFRVMARLLDQAGCQAGQGQQTWPTTDAGSRLMSATATCALNSMAIVPGSIQVKAGEVDSFRAVIKTVGEAEAGHDVLYPDAAFRGGLYKIEVETTYEFTALKDKVEITNATPDSAEPLEPGSTVTFDADFEYAVVTVEEAEIEIKLRSQVNQEILAMERKTYQRGSGTFTVRFGPLEIPESGELVLYAFMFDRRGAGDDDDELLAATKPVTYKIVNDLVIDHLEVVQVVQSQNNTVPLVAGKSTMVRVFTKLKNKTERAETAIPVKLQGFRGGRLSGPPLVNDGATAYTRYSPDRNRQSDSHNFYLPDGWFSEGPLTLVATVNAEGTVDELDAENNTGGTTVTFQTRNNFSVKYVPVCMQVGTEPKVCPDAPLGGAASFMRRIYPAADDAISYGPALIPPLLWKLPLDTEEDMDNLLIFLGMRLELAERLRGRKLADQLVGWIPNETRTPFEGFSYPLWIEGGSGRVAWIVDRQARMPQYMAHEVGHNLGLQHPGTGDSSLPPPTMPGWPYSTAGINENGWDVKEKSFKQGLPISLRAKRDLMTLCFAEHECWISPHHYIGLFNGNFVPQRVINGTVMVPTSSREAPAKSSAGPVRRAATTDGMVLVSGTVRQDGAGGTLDQVYRLELDEAAEVDDPDASSAYCLEFQTAGGATLGSHCFAVSFWVFETNRSVAQAPFLIRAAIPDRTARIALMANGTELAAREASTSAPTVQFTSPAPGAQWQGGTEGTLTWAATDADGDPLTYELFYSATGTDDWTPLAAGLTTTEYTFDPALIEGGSQVRFLVMANDGFHDAQATVGPITVLQVPAISVEDLTDAGSLMTGLHRSFTVPVANPGTGPLTISAMSIDSTRFALEAIAVPLVIPAGAYTDIPVRYSPEEVGEDRATLTLTSNATADPVKAVTLKGTGTDGSVPALNVSLEPIGLVGVAAGATEPVALSVGNDSLAELDLSWTVTGDYFSADSATATEMTLESLESGAIPIVFSPPAAGDYSGMLVITSNDPQNSRVEISLEGKSTDAQELPEVFAGGVVDAAQGGAALSPGGIGSIYGENLAGEVQVAAATPLPRELGGTKVLANGLEAPLFFVSSAQINFQMPFEAPLDRDSAVQVVRNGVRGRLSTVPVAGYACSVFMNYATGEPIVQHHADGSLVTATSPARAGEVITIYVTGIGDLTAKPNTGEPTQADPLPWANELPTVTVGGVEATVYYAGLTPGFVGLGQISIGMPESLPPGATLPLVIRFGDAAGPAVSLPVGAP